MRLIGAETTVETTAGDELDQLATAVSSFRVARPKIHIVILRLRPINYTSNEKE